MHPSDQMLTGHAASDGRFSRNSGAANFHGMPGKGGSQVEKVGRRILRSRCVFAAPKQCTWPKDGILVVLRQGI